jgi:hypothetical protein
VFVARGGLRRGIGGGPVSHAKLSKLERLAGPSVPSAATPHYCLDLTPRFSERAERRSLYAPASLRTTHGLGRRRLPVQNWI